MSGFPYNGQPTASGSVPPTHPRAKAGERRCAPGEGRGYRAGSGRMENGRQCQQWAGPRSGGRRGSAAPGRLPFHPPQPAAGAFPSVSNRPVRGGRAAGVPPHGARLTEVKRDFRARCRIGGPAALEALGRQVGTDIRHSAGVVPARVADWERRRLYRGRISGMNDEDNAGDAVLLTPRRIEAGERALRVRKLSRRTELRHRGVSVQPNAGLKPAKGTACLGRRD